MIPPLPHLQHSVLASPSVTTKAMEEAGLVWTRIDTFQVLDPGLFGLANRETGFLLTGLFSGKDNKETGLNNKYNNTGQHGGRHGNSYRIQGDGFGHGGVDSFIPALIHEMIHQY